MASERFRPGQMAALDQHRADAYSKGWWAGLTLLAVAPDGGGEFETSFVAVNRLTIQGADWYRINVCDPDDERDVFCVMIPVEAIDEANEPDEEAGAE